MNQPADSVALRLRRWAGDASLHRKLAFILAGVAVLSGMATVVALTTTSFSADASTVLSLLLLNTVLLLALSIIIGRRLYGVWIDRRRGLAGSRLHIRLVILFSLVALTPAIMVATFSWVFLNFGIDVWFNERVRTALGASRAVASAYLHEHRQTIRADALAMANDLNRQAPLLTRNPRLFNQMLSAQAGARGLPEALVVDGNGRILARSALSLSLEFDLVAPGVLEHVRQEGIVVLSTNQDDRVRAVVRLERFVDAYLLVGRFVDAKALEHIERTNRAVAQYESLEKRRSGIQITFVMIYAVVGMLLLLASAWIGLNLATQLVRPISGLIEAADRIRKGDLTVRVDVAPTRDETSSLSRAFNRMTSQMEAQQQGLMEANRQLDERRRFTETVLTGVSAGVIGLDAAGRIHLPNRSASELLSTDLEDHVGTMLGNVVPEMSALLADVMTTTGRQRQAEITVVRQHRIRTLLVRIAAERLGGDVIGYVVTFDDITELQSAQRKAAWADIARRIAHEIKNPLTPIRLSAERLKRKYMDEIETDPETFAICTDTIVRQVTDIGRMVDEFSAFARMPQPVMKRENLAEICRQAVFLEVNRHPEIAFSQELPDDVPILCDGQQVARALTNILKNAAESINGRHAGSEHSDDAGLIRISLSDDGQGAGRTITVAVEDNGMGLPAEERVRLTEPYVTTRDRGSGLGLAIVKKIMEDHDGDLVLEDRPTAGARVSLVFQPSELDNADTPAEEMASDAVNVASGTRAHGS